MPRGTAIGARSALQARNIIILRRPTAPRIVWATTKGRWALSHRNVLPHRAGTQYVLPYTRGEVMKRREFLRAAGAGLAASAIAAPAIAQSTPELKWRLTASWPKSLDTLYGMCEDFAKNVAESTDNKFQIQVF